jgi:hypothetical protein
VFCVKVDDRQHGQEVVSGKKLLVAVKVIRCQLLTLDVGTLVELLRRRAFCCKRQRCIHKQTCIDSVERKVKALHIVSEC